MIFTTRKDVSEILATLGGGAKWVLVGCAECAAICRTGGSEQLDEFTEHLEKAGKAVLASVSLASPCDRRLSRRDLKRVEAELAEADGVLCLCCGGGAQAIADLVEVPVVAGLDAHFAATVERLGVFREECSLCGDCVLTHTAGVCPETRCPKGLRNGPCEGSSGGRCDVDASAECAWELIYRRLSEAGRAEEFERVRPPPDASRWGRPRKTVPGGGQ